MVPFTKMNGAGNDFVMLDNRDLSLQLSKEQIELLCQRQRGVGSDGLIAVEPAENGADYKMRYYNADGGEAEMCGNGARCFARFVSKLENSDRDHVDFETPAGVIGADLIGDQVKIELSDPFDLKLNTTLSIAGTDLVVHFVNTGVPHAVVFVDSLKEVPILEWGAGIRYHETYQPAGTNVNFVQVAGDSHIAIRTYERGVENETLACGTGMAACAIIHHELHQAASPIKVDVAGGDTLEVGFDHTAQSYRAVTLLGPADVTYEGTFHTL